MFFAFILIFILIPVVELSVLIRVGEVLGSLTTVALVLFTAVVGVSLVRSQGLSTLMQAQQKMARGEAPTSELLEGMMLAMAGLLLLIPGFVTDFIGLLLLTPVTRKPLAALLLKRLQLRVVGKGGFGANFGQGPFNQGPFGQGPFGNDPFNREGGNTFDGDFERKDDPSAKNHQLEQPKEPASEDEASKSDPNKPRG